MPAQLHELSLIGVASAIASGDVSPVEVTDAILARIELKEHLNAFSLLMAEDAMKRARLLEEEVNRGHSRGPLHGVPVAVKDLCDVAGVATAAGIPAFRSRVSQQD